MSALCPNKANTADAKSRAADLVMSHLDDQLDF